MFKLTIKTRPVGEANEPDINKAYQEFSAALGGYNDNTANFMKDCVYISHSQGENGVKGLRKQGYKLNLAAQLDTDTLHTCYVKDEGGVHKAIDLYFNPHERKIEVVTVGFDPQYPHAESTKIFSVQKGADAFADFIEGLSDYKGESKMKPRSMQNKVFSSSRSLHENTGSFNPPTVNINGVDWMQDYLAIDDGGLGIYRNEKTGTLCYTIQAALRVAKNLSGWRLPNEEEIEALPLKDLNLKNTGAVELDRTRPISFDDDTPYLMGTKHVFFPSFGSSWASFNNANHAAPVKLIKDSVPTHTYQTPLARGTINDDGNFNGSYWSERHYKYNEMYRRVKSIVEDWTQRMKKKYPDVADVIYTKISEPWGRQSCMMVEYRTPLAEVNNLLEALRPTAVSIRNYLGPYEVKDIIYEGPEVGYYTRETEKHKESLSYYKGENMMKGSMRRKQESIKAVENTEGNSKSYDSMTYEISRTSKNDGWLRDSPWEDIKYNSADELYDALDEATGGSTRGNVTMTETTRESDVEGRFDLKYEAGGNSWLFRVWFTIIPVDPIVLVQQDLGL